MKKLRSCGVLIVRGDPVDSFLLMLHPDRYDLPKGHVDEGETDLECALRELEEETAITADDIVFDDDFRFVHKYKVRPKKYDRKECKKTLVIFLARLVNDVEIEVTEHDGYEWTKWKPPHKIQKQTIDPLLQHLASHLASACQG